MKTRRRRQIAILGLSCLTLITTCGSACTRIDGNRNIASSHSSALATKIDQLPVRDEESLQGYDRELFPHWKNASKNGWQHTNPHCDTRSAVLVRDSLTPINWKGKKGFQRCSFTGGSWKDPYGTFSRSEKKPVYEQSSNRRDFDIDHIIPLASAWRSGASNWDNIKRERFANDPNNVIAASDSANRSKGDSSFAQFVPISQQECHSSYTEQYIDTKLKWKLSVTKEEKEKIQRSLTKCHFR